MGISGQQVDPGPSPRYQIKRDGKTITAIASWSGRGWSLQQSDLDFALEIAAEIERACGYFYKHQPSYPFNREFDVLTNEQVEERIINLDQGENTREPDRVSKRRFPLTELPILWKRALVANLDQLACEWGFERLE